MAKKCPTCGIEDGTLVPLALVEAIEVQWVAVTAANAIRGADRAAMKAAIAAAKKGAL